MIDRRVTQIEIGSNLENLDLMDPRHAMGVADELEPKAVLHLALAKKLRHVIFRKNAKFEREVLTAERMLLSPSTFLESPTTVVLAPNSSVDPSPADLHPFHRSFSSAEERRDTLEAAETIIKDRIKSQFLGMTVLLSADEFMCNALRSLGKSANAPNPPLFFMAFDDERVFVGCQDHAGVLSVDELLTHFQKVYAQGLKTRLDPSGFQKGIGTVLAFDACLGFYIGVEQGRRTTVGCTFPLAPIRSANPTRPHNLHWFDLSTEAINLAAGKPR